MEFLVIYLTNNSSLLLYAIHRPFYWWILKIPILESRKLKYIHEWHLVEQKSEGRKLDKNSSACPENSTKNAGQEFYLWMQTDPEHAWVNQTRYILSKLNVCTPKPRRGQTLCK